MPAFSVRGSSNATTQRQEGTHVAKTGEEELVEINQSKQGKPESWRQLRDVDWATENTFDIDVRRFGATTSES